MYALFLKLLNMSAAGSVLILVVIVLRALQEKAPRWIPCALWALVALRLVCPVGIASPLSVVTSPIAVINAMTSAAGSPAFTPSQIVRLTSTMISPTLRSLQRGHVSRFHLEAQFVRFSLIVMVNTPPRPCTCKNTCRRESRSHRRVSGCDVQRA